MPTAPIESLAVFRLDGDLYESTMDALVAREPKVSEGGFVIVDDYDFFSTGAKTAVDEFTADHANSWSVTIAPREYGHYAVLTRVD